MATFLVTEATGFFLISRLNDPEDERYLRAQLASPSFYVVELAVLGSGALAAVLYGYWPGFLALGGPALLLMQRGLLHQPLQHEARHDAKTGVLNCEAWRATASSALGHARRQEQLVAVAVVDIDHFKTVNDVFGHLAGDDVLARTADAIVGCVRSTDLVGRFGGDEFCALLFCAGRDDALATAERIRRQIEQLAFSDPRLGGDGLGRTGHRADRRRRRERRLARAHGRRRPGPLPGQARRPEPGRRGRAPPGPGAAVRQLSPRWGRGGSDPGYGSVTVVPGAAGGAVPRILGGGLPCAASCMFLVVAAPRGRRAAGGRPGRAGRPISGRWPGEPGRRRARRSGAG